MKNDGIEYDPFMYALLCDEEVNSVIEVTREAALKAPIAREIVEISPTSYKTIPIKDN